jgi:hypothetical protein
MSLRAAALSVGRKALPDIVAFVAGGFLVSVFFVRARASAVP